MSFPFLFLVADQWIEDSEQFWEYGRFQSWRKISFFVYLGELFHDWVYPLGSAVNILIFSTHCPLYYSFYGITNWLNLFYHMYCKLRFWTRMSRLHDLPLFYTGRCLFIYSSVRCVRHRVDIGAFSNIGALWNPLIVIFKSR